VAAIQLPAENALVRNTVRLLAGPTPDLMTSTGTGFFYQVIHPVTNAAKVLMITNKHVVRGAEFVRFVLSSAPALSDLDAEHQPKSRSDDEFAVSLAGNLILHPEVDTDLCAIDVTMQYGLLLNSGRQIRAMNLDWSWVIEDTDRIALRDIEQVLVIGYPSGLWDSHNNMPIARRGITATHALARYQGKTNFLVDVAAFQGSSGSPVFLYESPWFRQPDGSCSPGTKVAFIGVVWGVVERTVTGELQAVEMPSAVTQVPVMQSPMNLAIALHADAVRDFDEIVFPGIRALQK